jgi:gas vesicle protein
MNRERVCAFLLGVGVGAVAGVLCAPSSGSSLRKSIADAASQTAGAAKKQAGDMWNATSDVLGSGAESIMRTRDALRSAVRAGRQAYHGSAAGNT